MIWSQLRRAYSRRTGYDGYFDEYDDDGDDGGDDEYVYIHHIWWIRWSPCCIVDESTFKEGRDDGYFDEYDDDGDDGGDDVDDDE